MGSIRARGPGNFLFLDIRHNGKRYREKTRLSNTASNRKKLERKLAKIEYEIALGRFNYELHFSKADILTTPGAQESTLILKPVYKKADQKNTPIFSNFIDEWVSENEIAWRRSHCKNIKGMIKKYYLPAFGEMEVGSIARAQLLKFRSSLAKFAGRNGNTSLSANRINKIMDPLRRIFEEAADRYDFSTPYVRIKPLRIQKSDVHPFSLDEVTRILTNVRQDYRNYYTVRFFTGMRTGEIDGLKWKYVDLERKIILIRETIVDGEEDYTKTDSSQRSIAMSLPVYEALLKQYKASGNMSTFVFCNLEGRPLVHNNVTKRVWYPLLKNLNLEKRRPYQTRHTAATLWLASGESPEWIARQMGHSTTEMLFKVYSRYVPNLTRNDGSAFERLLLQHQESLTSLKISENTSQKEAYRAITGRRKA